jgi:hypothetical protein
VTSRIRQGDDAATCRNQSEVRSGTASDGSQDDLAFTWVFINVSIDMINAYNEIKRAAVMDSHSRHTHMRRTVPFWRAKLGPTSKPWARKDNMDHHEGLVQGSPISSSRFSFTINDRVKKADGKLTGHGGYARFGMDDGYMVGPPEVVFRVLADFAKGLKHDYGCELNVFKCNMVSMEEGACEAAKRREYISEELQHVQEWTFVNESRDILRGIWIFNVPLGEEKCDSAQPREKAK